MTSSLMYSSSSRSLKWLAMFAVMVAIVMAANARRDYSAFDGSALSLLRANATAAPVTCNGTTCPSNAPKCGMVNGHQSCCTAGLVMQGQMKVSSYCTSSECCEDQGYKCHPLYGSYPNGTKYNFGARCCITPSKQKQDGTQKCNTAMGKYCCPNTFAGPVSECDANGKCTNTQGMD